MYRVVLGALGRAGGQRTRAHALQWQQCALFSNDHHLPDDLEDELNRPATPWCVCRYDVCMHWAAGAWLNLWMDVCDMVDIVDILKSMFSTSKHNSQGSHRHQWISSAPYPQIQQGSGIHTCRTGPLVFEGAPPICSGETISGAGVVFMGTVCAVVVYMGVVCVDLPHQAVPSFLLYTSAFFSHTSVPFIHTTRHIHHPDTHHIHTSHTPITHKIHTQK